MADLATAPVSALNILVGSAPLTGWPASTP
jgi:hypothetical protein